MKRLLYFVLAAVLFSLLMAQEDLQKGAVFVGPYEQIIR